MFDVYVALYQLHVTRVSGFVIIYHQMFSFKWGGVRKGNLSCPVQVQLKSGRWNYVFVCGWHRAGVNSDHAEFNTSACCSAGPINHEKERLWTHQRCRRWTLQLLLSCIAVCRVIINTGMCVAAHFSNIVEMETQAGPKTGFLALRVKKVADTL